ncbi:Rho GTPase-activating protein 17-like [Oopsacas minuta]|uniref:Rho GTPase-activating protein 17-like n=1 Tax=Oopsacas minuta TaxID=111878 RepID=A0AAV7JXJ8_9METZ|nr:Rho GTPase-activating protein 17-like [Oopsacas minuta]
MISTNTVTSSSISLTEDISSNPPPHIQNCIEELRSLGVTISRHRLYKEVIKSHSPKLRKKRRIGLALDQYEEIVTYKAQLGGVTLNLRLPSLLAESFCYLEDYLHVKGIFRKSPAVSRLRELEISLASGKNLSELRPPPHDVAGLVKSFLRSLPDPLFSEQIVSILIQCPSLMANELSGILLACTLLSPASLHCLQALLAMLALVAEHHSDNKMNENSLAVVIAPTLFYNRNSLKKPSKERATTQNIIHVIETMLNHLQDMAMVGIQGTADSEKTWKERKRTGSLSDLFKVFPRKNFKVRIASQPYPIRSRDIYDIQNPQILSGEVSEALPIIKKSVRGKRPLEKYKPLLTEAKRARLLEQSGNMKEVMIRRQIQIKDRKLVRRNAFLQRRGMQTTGSDVYITPASGSTQVLQSTTNNSPKIPFPFENIRENLEFKFISEDKISETVFPSPQKLNSQDSVATHLDTSGDMIRSRTEESLELFASSLLDPDSQTQTSVFDSTPNLPKKTMNKSSYTLPRPSMARRMNQQLGYFQCPENRVHINDKDVLLPTSIHEIYISANGCSSTPIAMLDSPIRVMSSVQQSADINTLPTQFGTVPLQRNIRLKDNPEATLLQLTTPHYTERHIQTDLPPRTRIPYQHTPITPNASQDKSNNTFSNSEISVDTTGLTDSETPASFHRQNPVRKSFRKLLSPVLPMKREGERDSFDKSNERSKSNSNPSSLKRNKPQRRWSLRAMFKSPTPPRPVINTTVISSPVPIKIPFHPVFTDRNTCYRATPPIVKRPCSKCTPPLDRVDYSPADAIGTEVTPKFTEWAGSPPSIISSENSDGTSYVEHNPQKQSLSKEDPLSDPLPPPLLHNTTATPSDNTSEDFLRDDSFSDTSFDTSPYLLDEESPVIHYPFVEASVFAKPHMGAIKVLPDLPPVAPLKRTKSPFKPATMPRGSHTFQRESSLKEVNPEIEVDYRPVPEIEKHNVIIDREGCCVETKPLPDVSDCVKLFEAMARPTGGVRRNTKIRASFTSFDNARNHSRLIKRTSMREPDRF